MKERELTSYNQKQRKKENSQNSKALRARLIPRRQDREQRRKKNPNFRGQDGETKTLRSRWREA